MKYHFFFVVLLFIFIGDSAFGQQTKRIHVFVALCDNVHQGIVPVSSKLGNGQNPASNLYWGALYGCKTYFRRDADWEMIAVPQSADPIILERVLFRHRASGALMLVDAYDGSKIKDCTKDFLLAANQQFCEPVILPDQENQENASFGGCADLVAYVGHDGLMEFAVDLVYQPISEPPSDAIILACASKPFFKGEISAASANPVLWTNNLMAPEAYVLDAALQAWLNGASGDTIHEEAAKAYNQYQKCGINGARRLFSTGFGD